MEFIEKDPVAGGTSMENGPKYSKFNYDLVDPYARYYRYKTLENRKDILTLGILIKDGENVKTTFEYQENPNDYADKPGPSVFEGERDVTSFYLEIPLLIDDLNLKFDDLRLTLPYYKELLARVVYNINGLEREKLNRLDDTLSSIYKNDTIDEDRYNEYKKEKEEASEEIKNVLDRLEIFYREDPTATVVPSMFIKYVEDDKEIIDNLEYITMIVDFNEVFNFYKRVKDLRID